MSEHHLLYWIFKVTAFFAEDNVSIDATSIEEDDFEVIQAPDWVWPAYQEALANFKDMK